MMLEIQRAGFSILHVFELVGRSPKGAVTVTGWCQLRVASSFLL